MKIENLSRPIGASIATVGLAFAGIVALPVTAANAAPTGWVCEADTFQVNRGGQLTQVDVATDTFTAGPALSVAPPNNFNAIGFHPISRMVYAIDILDRSPNSTIARVINQDGTIENVSATVPLTGATVSDYAGGTFTSDGYWLLAAGPGEIATIDLTSPASSTYGEAISTGTTGIPWLSGDMAYRASDSRIFFTTFNFASPANATSQVGWIPRADFVAGGAVAPTLGPVITLPPGTTSNVGAGLGFDTAGNMWMHTTTNNGDVVWRLDAAALTGTDPITPTVLSGSIARGPGSDGFMCFGPAATGPQLPTLPLPDSQLPTLPLPDSQLPTLPEPTLAATGTAAEAMPLMIGGGLALLAGTALFAFSRLRRGQARRGA